VPQTPLGEFTMLPRALCWISGGLLLRGRREEEGRKERGNERGE